MTNIVSIFSQYNKTARFKVPDSLTLGMLFIFIRILMRNIQSKYYSKLYFTLTIDIQRVKTEYDHFQH